MPSPSSAPSWSETLLAVGVLARAGVSDEALGRTVREWLTAEGAQPASAEVKLQTPALSAKAPSTPSGEQQAPAPRPAYDSRGSAHAPTPQSMPPDTRIPLKVHLTDGSATNILVPMDLLRQVTGFFGGDENRAKSLARQFAKEAPPSVKRTHWVLQKLQETLTAPN